MGGYVTCTSAIEPYEICSEPVCLVVASQTLGFYLVPVTDGAGLMTFEDGIRGLSLDSLCKSLRIVSVVSVDR